MPDTPKITVLKSFSYRGSAEEYSNTYHFSGTTPANDAAWKTLFDALVALERPVLNAAHAWVGGYGYNAGSEHANWSYDYAANAVTRPVGTMANGTQVPAPGDAAIWVRWRTADLSSTGKPVYLRKYFHGALRDPGDADVIGPAQKTALGTFGAAMIAGTLPGSVKVCGPQGSVASAPLACSYLTTRTLKRRGKRPSS